MSQRSYGNDRYRKGANVGSTRKSAAKAKPVRKQGTVEVKKPADKKKAKKKGPGGVEKDWSGLPTSPKIKQWRRVWWALLLVGIALVALGYAVPEIRGNESAQRVIAGVVVVASMSAVSIDLIVIRRLRNELMGKSSGASTKKKGGSEKDASGSQKKGAS